MTTKPVAIREAAHQDVENALNYYVDEAGKDVGLRFIAALESVYHVIATRPRTGSPRFAHSLDLPGLRSAKLSRFPYLVFYFEHEHHIDVLRVLHQRRDIPSSFDGDN